MDIKNTITNKYVLSPSNVIFWKTSPQLSKYYGVVEIHPLNKGYGITIANALRRILLSSIPGSAIYAISIEYKLNGIPRYVNHFLEPIPGVYEDTYIIIQNLKKVNIAITNDSKLEAVFSISKRGPGELKAGDLQIGSTDIEILNPDLHIATLDDGADITITFYVNRGIGYVSAEENYNKIMTSSDSESIPLGLIPIDSIYSPIEKVNFRIEEHHLGNTSADKVIMEIWTNGVISPSEAFKISLETLISQLNTILSSFTEKSVISEELEEIQHEVKDERYEKILNLLNRSIEDLELSVRSLNCLRSANILRIGDLVKKTEEELLTIRNLGKKSIKEITEKLASKGLRLGVKDPKELVEEGSLEVSENNQNQ